MLSGTEPSLILLSLGTHQQPFARALDLVEPLARGGENLIIQHGSTAPKPEMPNTIWVEFMAFDALVDTLAKVDSLVCHAGVGTIMTALKTGHRPVVIPRLAKYGEHIDDHQLDIATRFAERGLVRCLTPQADLAPPDLAPLLTLRDAQQDGHIGKGSDTLRAAVSEAVAVGPTRRHIAFPSRNH